jgi:phospholipid/cholesterol/gamma-HCH transport system substrate-binding protein
MNSRSYALATGAFVLLLTAAVIMGAMYFSGLPQSTRPYVVVTRGNVDGLAPQSKVFFRGIPSGKVTALRFDPADPRRILVDIQVDASAPVTEDTYAQLKLQGFTGLSQLELQTHGTSTVALATSAQQPAQIPMEPSLLDRLSDTGSQVLGQLQTLSSSLNQVLDAKNRERIASLLAQTDAASAALVRLEHDLDDSARRMPALVGQMQSTLKQIDAAASQLERLARTADQLGASGRTAGATNNRETLPQLESAMAQISAAAGALRELAETLRKNPQQVLEGPQRPPPGPGERGYRAPSR